MAKRGCAACGAKITQEIQRLTKRLLTKGLDEPRRSSLAAMYNGKLPEQMCPECFNTTLGALNGVAA